MIRNHHAPVHSYLLAQGQLAIQLINNSAIKSPILRKTFLSLPGVSAIFYVVAFISLVQLLICCFAEYKRLKNPSFLKACRITTQKVLYFVVFLASLLRAAYFTQPESLHPQWAYYLMSAYYPLLMTCASLVVCFWAEVKTICAPTLM